MESMASLGQKVLYTKMTNPLVKMSVSCYNEATNRIVMSL